MTSFFMNPFGNNRNTTTGRAAGSRSVRRLGLEPLEDRQMLSATPWETAAIGLADNVSPSMEAGHSDLLYSTNRSDRFSTSTTGHSDGVPFQSLFPAAMQLETAPSVAEFGKTWTYTGETDATYSTTITVTNTGESESETATLGLWIYKAQGEYTSVEDALAGLKTKILDPEHSTDTSWFLIAAGEKTLWFYNGSGLAEVTATVTEKDGVFTFTFYSEAAAAAVGDQFYTAAAVKMEGETKTVKLVSDTDWSELAIPLQPITDVYSPVTDFAVDDNTYKYDSMSQQGWSVEVSWKESTETPPDSCIVSYSTDGGKTWIPFKELTAEDENVDVPAIWFKEPAEDETVTAVLKCLLGASVKEGNKVPYGYKIQITAVTDVGDGVPFAVHSVATGDEDTDWVVWTPGDSFGLHYTSHGFNVWQLGEQTLLVNLNGRNPETVNFTLFYRVSATGETPAAVWKTIAVDSDNDSLIFDFTKLENEDDQLIPGTKYDFVLVTTENIPYVPETEEETEPETEPTRQIQYGIIQTDWAAMKKFALQIAKKVTVTAATTTSLTFTWEAKAGEKYYVRSNSISTDCHLVPATTTGPLSYTWEGWEPATRHPFLVSLVDPNTTDPYDAKPLSFLIMTFGVTTPEAPDVVIKTDTRRTVNMTFSAEAPYIVYVYGAKEDGSIDENKLLGYQFPSVGAESHTWPFIGYFADFETEEETPFGYDTTYWFRIAVRGAREELGESDESENITIDCGYDPVTKTATDSFDFTVPDTGVGSTPVPLSEKSAAVSVKTLSQVPLPSPVIDHTKTEWVAAEESFKVTLSGEVVTRATSYKLEYYDSLEAEWFVVTDVTLNVESGRWHLAFFQDAAEMVKYRVTAVAKVDTDDIDSEPSEECLVVTPSGKAIVLTEDSEMVESFVQTAIDQITITLKEDAVFNVNDEYSLFYRISDSFGGSWNLITATVDENGVIVFDFSEIEETQLPLVSGVSYDFVFYLSEDAPPPPTDGNKLTFLAPSVSAGLSRSNPALTLGANEQLLLNRDWQYSGEFSIVIRGAAPDAHLDTPIWVDTTPTVAGYYTAALHWMPVVGDTEGYYLTRNVLNSEELEYWGGTGWVSDKEDAELVQWNEYGFVLKMTRGVYEYGVIAVVGDEEITGETAAIGFFAPPDVEGTGAVPHKENTFYVDSDITLKWTRDDGNYTYAVQYRDWIPAVGNIAAHWGDWEDGTATFTIPSTGKCQERVVATPKGTGGVVSYSEIVTLIFEFATPTAPTNVKVVVDGTENLKISWDTVTYARSYLVQWFNQTTLKWETKATVTAATENNSVMIPISEVLSDGMNHFQVIALTDGGKLSSPPSDVASIYLGEVDEDTVAFTQVIVREFITTAPNMTSTFGESLTKQQSKLNEWSHFYIECWAMAAEDGSVILSFDDFTFWYDTALFQIDTILGGMYCDVFWYPDYDNEGNVLVKGNLKDNMDTTSLTVEDGWVLLFRATLTPATMIPTGAAMYSSEVTTLGITAPVGVDFSGIVAMVLTTAKDGEETIGGALAETPDELLTYPVIYDVVHDNRIDLRDFSVFIKAFGKNKKDIDPELWEKYAQCDFVPDGVINLKDFQLFIKAFGRTKETGIRNDIIPVPPPIPAPAATLAPSVSAGLMVMEGAATEGEPPALVGGYHAAVLSAELGAFPLSLSAADTMYTDRAVKPAAVLPIDTAILAVVDTIDMFDFSAKVAETEFNVLNAVGVLEW